MVRLRLAVGGQKEAEEFWSDDGLELVREALQSLLSRNCSLELLVLPHTAQATHSILEVWDSQHGVRSSHSQDTLANVTYSLR